MFTVYSQNNKTLVPVHNTEDYQDLKEKLKSHDKKDQLFVHAKFDSIDEWVERVLLPKEEGLTLYLQPVDEQLDHDLRKMKIN